MFQNQPIMRKVVYALVPLFILSVVLYGWRAILMPLVVFPLGILTEYLMEKAKKKAKTQVTEAVLVTSALFSLSLPPGLPIWVAGLGIIFSVVFGKMVFGGFGRNIFNPAITGRVFIYLAFPAMLGTLWMVPGAAANWNPLTLIMEWIPGGIQVGGVDVITTATVMDVLKTNTVTTWYSGETFELVKNIPQDWMSLFVGWEPGSMGETSALLILLAGLYLMFTPVVKKNKDGTSKLEIQPTANYRMIIGTIVSAFAVMAAVYYLPQWFPGFPLAPRRLEPVMGILSGSILFVAVFMATDPVTGPKKPASQWVYGILIGSVSVLIRMFAGFPEGVSFGILFANTFASLLDETIGKWGAKKKIAAPKAPAAPVQEVKA